VDEIGWGWHAVMGHGSRIAQLRLSRRKSSRTEHQLGHIKTFCDRQSKNTPVPLVSPNSMGLLLLMLEQSKI